MLQKRRKEKKSEHWNFLLFPSRNLFPALVVNLQGLDPLINYNVSLRVAPVDNQRHRYINTKWCAVGESKVQQNKERQTINHPSSPNIGQFWMNSPLSFDCVKITHYENSKHGNVSIYLREHVISLLKSCDQGLM